MKSDSETGSDGAGDGEMKAAILRHRILIVDDHEDGADSLTSLLQSMGHDVSIGRDGLQAVEIAIIFKPHVVIMDIALPRLNGYDAARRIREMPGGERIVLVALTGWSQEEDRRQATEAGFDHHWVKPVDLQALRDLLARVARG